METEREKVLRRLRQGAALKMFESLPEEIREGLLCYLVANYALAPEGPHPLRRLAEQFLRVLLPSIGQPI
jgi:hypothetical protein